MEKSDDLKKVRYALRQLFEQLAINRVICVDDQYDESVNFDRFKMLYLLLPEERQSIPELLAIPTDDPDFFDDTLEAFWEGLSNRDKSKITSKLRALSNIKNDTQYANVLKDLLQPYNFRELSLARWRREKPTLISESLETRTLFLFDQDFRNEGGSNIEGFSLIEDIFESKQADNIICGLLSHTFEPEKEQELLEKYSTPPKASKDGFVFISKRRLLNDPIEFVRRIKLTALSPLCKQLKKEVSTVIEQAHTEAFNKVEAINIYEFEQIIFQSSQYEGVWEPDTLFRLFGLYHRTIAREKARVKDELHEIAANIRPISTIKTHSAETPKPRTWEIQRIELYESENYVNSLYMPIELGDIFEVILSSSVKKFILLAQPCDLMVRSSGNRKQAVTEAILAEIVNPAEMAPTSKDEKGRPIDQDAFYELLYFDNDGQKRYVSFQQKHALKLFTIDLCAFQNDGKALLNVKDGCPKYIIPTWHKHYANLVEKANQILNQYQKIQKICDSLPEDDAKTIRDLALAKTLELPTALTINGEENLFIGDINPTDASISFNLRRCGRLSQSHSVALLAKFASFFARAAFEHDFGEVKNK